jgi:hypothetical protein
MIMSYTDLRDFRPDVTFDVPQWNTDDPTLTIAIEKLGGGTVGKAYTGTWRYVVRLAGTEIAKGQDLDSGTALTHEEAAHTLADFLAYRWDEDEIGIELCERLSAWSHDEI